MATKKTSKTTKTAHVLNVLSGGQAEGAPGEEETLSPELAPAPAAPIHPNVPPMLDDAHVSDQALMGSIHDALSQELEEEGLPPVEEAPVEEIPVEEAPVAEPAPEPAPEPEPEPAPMPKAKAAAAPPSEEDRHAASTTMLPGDLVYVNIMQALVEEKAQKYIEMFGLCTCSRCQADVKAIALSNLPPKYMVMPKGEFVPMLTVYERQYGTALTAHIISACRKVMDEPRHTIR